MPARVLTALAALAVACAATAAPLQQVENLNVGPAPSALAIDAVSGRVIIGNSGSGRGHPGSLAVLERSGKLTTVATPSAPLHVAVSAARRKAVATLDREGAVAILDLDTLALRTLAAGRGPSLSLIDDAAGKAYVIGAERAMDLARGWVSVIDLATYEVQSYSSVGFAPEDAVLAADGKRLYLVGNHGVRSGEYKPGFVQAFDIPGRRFVGAPTALGREAKRVARSPRGDRLYVAGHTDQYRDGFPAGDLRRHSIRGALFTLDAATLALERTTALPDTRNLGLHGPMLTPQLQVDPATGFVHVLEWANAWLAVVDAGNARLLHVTDFETQPAAFALNAQSGTTVVSLPRVGQAAILSRGGARLDSVPLGRSTGAYGAMGSYAVAVDDATGDTYVTNAHDQSLSILRRNGEAAALVNLTDVWHDPADPGWGVFMDHQGIVVFAALFTHDAAGDPTWFVMSNGVRQADGSFSGVLYRTRGPVTQALGDITPAGIMRITPDTAGNAKVLWVVDGQSHTRVLERFVFDGAGRACGWSVGGAKSSAPAANFTSLWSDPREQGWGVAISQQGTTAFGVLFNYDAQNRPTWSVMSAGRQQENGVFSGELFRARRGRIEAVGSLSLDFSGNDAGAVTYRQDGVDYRAPIARQALTPLVTRCVQ